MRIKQENKKPRRTACRKKQEGPQERQGRPACESRKTEKDEEGNTREVDKHKKGGKT